MTTCMDCFMDARGTLLLNINIIGDGPFDIRGGGGAGIFPCDKLFFSLFAQQVIFSKVNYSKFFIFLKKTTYINQKNVNESNTLNEKVRKNLKFLFDH